MGGVVISRGYAILRVARGMLTGTIAMMIRTPLNAALVLSLLLSGCAGGSGVPGFSDDDDDGFSNPGPLTPPANHGPRELLPDLTVNEPMLANSWEIGTEDRPASDCAVVEGCLVANQGPRDVLRFDVGVANVGEKDLYIGAPDLLSGDFDYSECHGHYHHIGFAEYSLSNASGVVATGRKQAFCLMDISDYQNNGDSSRYYDCADQGISLGWQDVYDKSLDCQWIDVTGLPGGAYSLSVTVNAEGRVYEAGPAPNTVSVPVTLP